MFEIRSDIPVPVPKRELHLELARQIYFEGGTDKSKAARKAIGILGGWGSSKQSQIDFIRQRLK